MLNPHPIAVGTSCEEKSDFSQPSHEWKPDSVLPSASKSPRYGLPDALRGIAAVLIVWHHLTLYAPQSDLADIVAPDLMFFLYNRALYAVQAFMVIGGFSVAVSMAGWPQGLQGVVSKLVSKYLRVGIPCMVMLAALLLTSYLFLAFGVDLGLVERVSLGQIIAGIFFLQDVLGFGNIAAGTWYLCIDLQYSLLFFVLYGVVGRFVQDEHAGAYVLAILLSALGLMGAFYWNGRLEYESYVSYFLAPFVLGTLVGFALRSRVSPKMMYGYGLVLMAAWVLQPRPQLAVAIVTGAVLWVGASRYPELLVPRWLRWLGDRSYSLFLVHYGVNGVVLGLLNPWANTGPIPAFVSMWIAFAASVAISDLFWRWVEVPSHRLAKRMQSQRIQPLIQQAIECLLWVRSRNAMPETPKIT